MFTVLLVPVWSPKKLLNAVGRQHLRYFQLRAGSPTENLSDTEVEAIFHDGNEPPPMALSPRVRRGPGGRLLQRARPQDAKIGRLLRLVGGALVHHARRRRILSAMDGKRLPTVLEGIPCSKAGIGPYFNGRYSSGQ